MRGTLLAIFCVLLSPRYIMPAELPGSIAGDSLLMPTEVFVITREELIERNVHTFDDILLLIPGVSLWREGPHGAEGGFSIDGRSHRGVNLLVNGIPTIDAYTLESLTRFLPLSRLLRVEVFYSGSPCFSGDLSSRGFINVVLEEGGREGPASEIDFTYGTANRRAAGVVRDSAGAHERGARIRRISPGRNLCLSCDSEQKAWTVRHALRPRRARDAHLRGRRCALQHPAVR